MSLHRRYHLPLYFAPACPHLGVPETIMPPPPPRLTAARAAGLVALCLLTAPARASEVKLARHPDYHNGKIVFCYLGDLWTAHEDGSDLRRLTVHRARDI